jgi:hypothetical protein
LPQPLGRARRGIGARDACRGETEFNRFRLQSFAQWLVIVHACPLPRL